MRPHFTILISATLAATACGKKSSSSSSNTGASTVKGQVLGSLNLTQKTNAATPKGFKKSTSLALNSTETCGTAFPEVSGSRPEGYYSCLAAFEIRDRFFQRGPTVITNRLQNVDDRLNWYVGKLAEFRIPCLDPSHTEDTTEVVARVGSETEETVPAYALSENSIATTFSDGHTLDLGRKYYFSCADSFDSQNIFVGNKDNAWYLGELQSTSAGSSAPAIRSVMSLDKDENLELLFGIAGPELALSTATNPEAGDRDAVYQSVYKTSSGFAQFVVRPFDNVMGASAIMDYACEQRLVMNDKAVYVEVNGNNYGSCFAGDTWASDHPFDSNKFNLKGCLKVSGALPEPQTDLSLCEESGLLVANEAGDGYEDPFAKYGILKLNTNVANPPADGFAVRAYHGVRLAPNLGDGTNELQQIKIPESATVEVEGYASSSFSFNKADGSSDSDAGTVAAACNADEATRQKSFTQTSEFPIQTWIDQASEQSEVTADSAVEALNAALQNTGDAAPHVNVRITRSLGATFTGISSGTLTLKYGDATVGIATVDQSGLAADQGFTDVKITFSTVPTVAATGKFTLEYSGKTLLSCNNATSMTRKANSHMGLASLKFFVNAGE